MLSMNDWQKERREMARKNVDAIGRKWALAPGGYDSIQRSESRLYVLSTELRALSSLFQSLNTDCALNGEDLYGTGEYLKRLARRVDVVRERLGKVTTSEDSVKPLGRGSMTEDAGSEASS
jgi:hypothetical protein